MALILSCSPDGAGFTEQLCAAVAEGIESKGCAAEVVRISGMSIGHCRDCGLCASGPCVLDDDMQRIYDLVEKADAIVIATPVHFETPSSLAKVAIDRFQRYWYSHRDFGGTVITMVASGGRSSPRFDSVAAAGRSLAFTMGAEWREPFTLAGTDGMDRVPEDVLADARAFGASLTGNGCPERNPRCSR